MAEHSLAEHRRENWGSRAGFVLAAVGSAVGLGNLWGFPYKVYDNGGGAFLIPYLVAMILVGIPLLILEFSLGHMTQRAAPDAFRGVNRKTEPLGWWGILLGFVIVTYYPVILAYCVYFLYHCVASIVSGEALPWAGVGEEGVKQAETFFFQGYLRKWTEGELAAGAQPWHLGGLLWKILLPLVLVWLLMYFCIFRGVKLVSKVVLWTVPLPWIMLVILMVRAMTLPGSTDGLNFFLSPDWSRLAMPETWRWAFGQMFFSMSLAFGVMITYASFLHRKSDINNNATIIGLADIGTSFMAGIAVFATLGAMAFASASAGAPVGVEKVVDGGPSLAFVVFPYALAQLPHAEYFGAVFFVALLTLGIDSAFSITESVLTALVDKTGWNRGRTLIGMSLVGLLAGVVYCTRGGLNWLGTMDEFINNTWGGICLIGLLEAVVIGWAYRLGRLREHANERSDWTLGVWWEWIIRYIAPLILSVLFAWSLIDRVSGEFLYSRAGELNVLVLAALIVAVVAPVAAMVLSCFHSPGADAHAQHVGQQRYGRWIGLAGLLAVVAAGAMIYRGAPAAYAANYAGKDYMMALADVEDSPVPAIPTESINPAIAGAWPWLAGGCAAALAALALGASVVHTAERRHRRPSGLGRLAAGLGVLLLGGSAGLGLSLAVLPGGLDRARAGAEQAVAETLAQAPSPADANAPSDANVPTDAIDANAPALAEADANVPASPPASGELDATSYLVLTGMIALLVVGLGVCFYLAIKAGGSDDEPQVAEGMED